MHNWFALEGSPSPLGVTWVEDEAAYNFALYSKHATAVTLLLYAEIDLATPTYEHRLNPLINKSGRIWHCRLRKNSIPDARYYAYQVAGPKEVDEGHRFDPRKVLLDPYARCVCFPTRFNRAAASSPGSNAGRAPLGLIACEPHSSWAADQIRLHGSDLVIYELYVRGFTRRANSGAATAHRGTFLGVIEKYPI